MFRKELIDFLWWDVVSYIDKKLFTTQLNTQLFIFMMTSATISRIYFFISSSVLSPGFLFVFNVNVGICDNLFKISTLFHPCL